MLDTLLELTGIFKLFNPFPGFLEVSIWLLRVVRQVGEALDCLRNGWLNLLLPSCYEQFLAQDFGLLRFH